MKVKHEPLYTFRQSDMFVKSKMCKVFELDGDRQSGDAPHVHDYTQIWFVTRGCCRHTVEASEYAMTRGDLFMLPPQMVHTTVLTPGSSAICCEFSLDRLFADKSDSDIRQVKETALSLSFIQLFMQETPDLQACCRLSMDGARRVEECMRLMLAEYEGAQVFFEDYLYLILQQVLLLIVREYTLSPAHETSSAVYERYRSMVQMGVQYVDEHYTETITLEDVCRVSMVSKTYFCYLFKLITQKTFKEYMMSLRIRRAVELLDDPRNSVTWISAAVGFSDSTHFSRTFKRLMGVSPRFYRSVHESES